MELTRNNTKGAKCSWDDVALFCVNGSPRTCQSSQQRPQASASWEVESPGFWGAEDEEKSVSVILTFHWACILEF